MRDEYYEIYRDLYDMYRRRTFMPVTPEWYFGYDPRFEWRTIRWTTEAIEDSISELSLTKQVRPDAKHFLLVNLHQLIVLPLIYPGSERIEVQKLRDILRSDVMQILKHSLKSNEYDKRKEISGGIILKSISEIWNKLSLNEFKVWGE